MFTHPHLFLLVNENIIEQIICFPQQCPEQLFFSCPPLSLDQANLYLRLWWKWSGPVQYIWLSWSLAAWECAVISELPTAPGLCRWHHHLLPGLLSTRHPWKARSCGLTVLTSSFFGSRRKCSAAVLAQALGAAKSIPNRRKQLQERSSTGLKFHFGNVTLGNFCHCQPQRKMCNLVTSIPQNERHQLSLAIASKTGW